jgi:RNA polymerase sigma-70 factor (ECF subfamily)
MVADSAMYEPSLEERFASFFTEFYPRVRVYVRRRYPAEDAEEIAQEVMSKAAVVFSRLDLSRDAWPWLRAVTCNHVIDLVQSRKRERMYTETRVRVVPAEGDDNPEDLVVARETCDLLRQAMTNLSPHERSLLTWHHLDGMSLRDIAEISGCKENAVRQRVFRARVRLAKVVAQLGGPCGVVPALRIVWRQLRRPRPAQVALPAMAGALIAVGALIGANFGHGATTAPALGALPTTGAVMHLTPVAHATDTSSSRPGPTAAPATARAATVTPGRTAANVVAVRIAKDPLRPGQTASNDIRIHTPLGEDIVVKGDVITSTGNGITCALTGANCDP